jgi:hypothetical protein
VLLWQRFVERYAPLSQGRFTIFLLLGTAVLIAAFAGLVRVTAALQTTSGLQSLDHHYEGYLLIARSDSYRFIVPSKVPAELSIEGVAVANERMTTGGPAVTLSRGLHAVRLQYSSGAARQPFLLVARGAMGAFGPVPRLYLVPHIIGFDETRLRRFAVPAGRAAPLLLLSWALVAAALFFRYGRSRLVTSFATGDSGLGALLLGSAALFIAASWWGVPTYFSWAPDEILPDSVRTAFEARFSNGWATKYPPAHILLLAGLSLPHYLGAHFGLFSLDDLQVASALLLLSRLTNVVMALGIVWATYATTTDIYGRRAAIFAALVVISAMPLTYYAKIANLDVPYVFWLSWALRYYSRTATTATTADFFRFALAGAAAIATKDQAYGFFVLPALVIAVMAWARAGAPGVPSKRVLLGMSAVTVLAVLVLMDVPFNPSGFLLHVQLITGAESRNFRMYSRTIGGTGRMLADGVRLLGTSMSWPLLIAAAAAAAMVLRRRNLPGMLLLVAALSYVVTFLWIVLYQYDRFWLGVVVALAPVTGWWLDTFTAPGRSLRIVRLSAAAVMFTYAIGRCAALDVLMLRDSRYVAERRLRAEAKPGEGVTAIGQRFNLPRPEIVPWTEIRARPGEFEQQSRPLIVVNVAHGLRRGEGFDDALIRTLLPSDPRYVLLGAFRSKVPFPLSLEPRFNAIEEDDFSNLTKINPLIRLYRRRPDATP